MSKKDECMAQYRASLNDKCGVSNIDEALLEKVVRGLGPSIYLVDASKVSCSDKAEIKRVKDNFCTKKLGMTDDTTISAACDAVVRMHQQMAGLLHKPPCEMNKEEEEEAGF